MNKCIISILAAAAAVVSSAVLAGGLQLNPSSEVFQYGDSMYTWDLESGGAVRVGAVWDGFAPVSSDLFQQGDFIYQRNAVTGEAVKVGAVWDGRVADAAGTVASARKAGPTLASTR
jgi:hypothetical protein